MDVRFRLHDVFSIDGDPFSGNPLCVFEDAAGLTDRVTEVGSGTVPDQLSPQQVRCGSAGPARSTPPPQRLRR